MITSLQFGQSFDRVTQEQMTDLLQCWSSQPRFTSYIKNNMMPAIAGRLGCSTQLEYKRIDIVLRSPYAPETIAIAIEHENNFGGSHQEITKLRDFNAPLGVLITYVGERLHQELLDRFDKIMSSVAEQSIRSERSELLVILGPYGMTPPKTLEWRYFLYQGNGFQQLKL